MTNDKNLTSVQARHHAISDAMDRLGIGGQCLGIKPLDPNFG